MRRYLFIVLVLLPICASSTITFQIETLSKPSKLISLSSGDQTIRKLVISESADFYRGLDAAKTEESIGLVAKYKASDSLIYYGQHAFFEGMYRAYADHRPFILSPDIIWLLISQGFSQHVNNNAEKLRPYFVNFQGKTTLIVKNNAIRLNKPNSPWESLFPTFTKQIDAAVGKDLVQTLTCDFSTSTPTTAIASQITIMDAVKVYFDYVVFSSKCGIPEITLEGTPEDWKKMLVKVENLRKYDLDWWVDELVPLLNGFVNASEGNIDIEFWKAMFKYHTENRYGAPNIIDGWMVKFFPYKKDGTRNNLKELLGSENLTQEVVKVPLEFMDIQADGTVIQTPLEIWAGFIGLQQNSKNYALRPEIGWFVRKRSIIDPFVLIKMKESSASGGLSIRVKSVPMELTQLGKLKNLTIEFTDGIVIPEELNKLNILNLYLKGGITDDESDRIAKMLTNTNTVIINGKTYIGGRSLK